VLTWPNSPRRDLVFILIVTFAFVLPMIVVGDHWGHDLEIHLQSWMEASGQFRQGILFPRWASGANYGFGEPRFIFYPPGSWMLGGTLGLLLPWTIVPAVYVWLCMILAALAMRRLAADWLSPHAAVFAATLYALNPYLLVTAYARCAYAELLASAIFPLLLSGALRIERDPPKAITVIAVSFAAIWLSNLPAGVIAVYALGCVLVVVSVVRRSIKPLLYGAAGAFTGLGLAAFTLIPAAWEEKWVYIDAVVRPNQLPTSNFLFSPFGVVSMYRFNHQFSRLAVLLILVAVASAIAARRTRDGNPVVWWSLTILCGIAGFLMFPISAPIWRILPVGRFVQFPWRWTFPLCTGAALLLAFAGVRSSRKRILLPALVLVLFAIDATIVHAKEVFPHFVDSVAEKFQAGRGYAGLLEYTPLPSKGRSLPVDAPLIAPVDPQTPEGSGSKVAGVYPEIWSPEKKVIRADLSEPKAVNLKLLAYPAWQATVNGRHAVLQENSQTGQLIVLLPAGRSRTEIVFTRTWDRSAGLLISIGCGAALLAYWQFVALRRKRAAEAPELEVVPARAA
jgi:hypothetical protein